MSDFTLDRLGSDEFEHLAQALIVKVLGANVEVFGDGRDGGREATFTGTIRDGADGQTWTGYLVAQAKYLARSHGTGQDTDWFLSQARKELDGWRQRKEKQPKTQVPGYMLFITNVVLSPLPASGGMDRFEELAAEYRDNLGIERCTVWSYDKLCSLLDDAADIRRTYLGYLLTGDVLARLMELLGGWTKDIGPLLTGHAIMSLRGDNGLLMTDAGDAADTRPLRLSEVAVDLPATIVGEDEPRSVAAVQHIIAAGDAVLRPSRHRAGPPHFLVIGGPGQGKTTIGFILAQAYRTAMLDDAPHLSRAVEEIRRETVERMAELEIPQPRLKRWPVRVDLADYADEVAGGQDLSLLRWLASLLGKHLTEEINPRDLKAWLHEWPWLLVLDGLDEVASNHARDQLMKRLEEFFEEAQSVDADLLVVATTRPQGYGGEFRIQDFATVDLDEFDAEEAVSYATRLASARHRENLELRDAVVDRIRKASEEPLTRRLMRTPLQVTIMSLLLEGRRRPPQDRHALFEAYYATIFKREASKSGPLAKLLDEHAGDIDAIHEQIGFELQVLSEGDGDAEASLPQERLREVLAARLATEGNTGAAATKLESELLRATRDRLVMLVPRGGGQRVGFEVRSLQEYMASRALTRGPDGTIIDRLRTVALSSHWRNVWLLAAGAVFRDLEHLRGQFLSMLREFDCEDYLLMVAPEGPWLAVALLDDDVAARSPKYRRMLLEHALDALRRPPANSTRLARVLLEVSRDGDLEPLVLRALETALGSDPAARATASQVVQALSPHTGPVPLRARQMTRRLDPLAIALNPLDGREVKRTTLRDAFPPEVRAWPSGSAEGAFIAMLSGAPALSVGPDHLVSVPTERLSDDSGPTYSLVTDTRARDEVALAIDSIPVENWCARATIIRMLVTARGRIPAAQQLGALMTWGEDPA